MEREKPTSVLLEKQREALVKGVEVATERGRDDGLSGAEPSPDAGPADGPGRRTEDVTRPGRDLTTPPLPRARWGPARRPLELSLARHEELATRAEEVLRRLLLTDNYDSVSNFISLFEAWDRAGDPLGQVYSRYAPPIRARKHTCVGLGLELVRRWRGLEREFSGVTRATALLSCEEAVVDVREYVTCGDGPAAVLAAEKEHVMVGIQIRVDGRPGVMLADPGYHVPRIVTVMQDRNYPHTGWFVQSDEPHCRKEYSYSFNPLNPGYVEWHERETRGEAVKCQTSLVYAARPYLDGVNVTERRNLVYNFRSLLSRDQKGHLIAGLYFPVGATIKDAQFTLFLNNGPDKRKTKYKFSTFADPLNIPETISEEIQLCNAKMNYKEGELQTIICQLAQVMANQAFIDQMLEINDDICRMCL
ncbi:hypothetical protein PYW08_005262 [Mythimna loreyi]|uniref:Uncharacterized protein n=1 Tax=Mythimna loreyi TaxID=667449 RepID=A0ACC2QGJ3_9NEOP|nr:hypothetical protein PYW08_005262 [Mythimna loreyi]